MSKDNIKKILQGQLILNSDFIHDSFNIAYKLLTDIPVNNQLDILKLQQYNREGGYNESQDDMEFQDY